MDWRKIACVNGYVISAVLYVIYYYTHANWLVPVSGVILLASSVALMVIYALDMKAHKKAEEERKRIEAEKQEAKRIAHEEWKAKRRQK